MQSRRKQNEGLISDEALKRWRCRESNPGPKQTTANVYKLSHCLLTSPDDPGVTTGR